MSLEKLPLNTHILVWLCDFWFFLSQNKNQTNSLTKRKKKNQHKNQKLKKPPTKNPSDDKTWIAKFWKKNLFTTNLGIWSWIYTS